MWPHLTKVSIWVYFPGQKLGFKFCPLCSCRSEMVDPKLVFGCCWGSVWGWTSEAAAGLYCREMFLWCLAWFLVGLVHILFWKSGTWLRRSKLEMSINVWGLPVLSDRDSGFALWDPYWYLLGLREGTCLDSACWIRQLLFLRLGMKGSKMRRLVPFLSAMACCFRQG